MPFAGLSDRAQSSARDLWFRPSDEDADPGLALRFGAAYDTMHPRKPRLDDDVMFGDDGRVSGPTLEQLLAEVGQPMRDSLRRGLGLAAGEDPLRSHQRI